MGSQIKRKKVTVIGGANMDISGSPRLPLMLHDSNPGAVRLRPGGVGRNIAHDLRLLGVETGLITALGDDLFGDGLRRSCEALDIDLSLSLTVPGQRSSTYLYVTEGEGDMLVGVADMDIVSALTPEALAARIGRINRADAVVIDANLSAEAVSYLAENCLAPLYADPVSTAKAPRLKSVLPKLAAIKPNLLEAELLTGEREPEAAARALLAAGVRRVFISLGAQGILAAEGDALLRLPCLPGPVVNTNGAGDAAMAAIVWAGLRGLELGESAAAALRAGAQVCACAETNPPELLLEEK